MASLPDLLERLEPFQQRVVRLVYFEGRSPAEAARILTVERVAVGAALAISFRRIAQWTLDDETRGPADRA